MDNLELRLSLQLRSGKGLHEVIKSSRQEYACQISATEVVLLKEIRWKLGFIFLYNSRENIHSTKNPALEESQAI